MRAVAHPARAALDGEALRTVVREMLKLAAVAVVLAPLVADWAGLTKLPAVLAGLTGAQAYRQATGFSALGIILLQIVSATLASRHRSPLARERWRSVHKVGGLPLAMVILAHTGARGGTNLNALLFLTMGALLLAAQGGHVGKAWAAWRAVASSTAQARALDREMNTESGWIHQSGYQLHVLLVTLAVVQLVFHVLAVYYF